MIIETYEASEKHDLLNSIDIDSITEVYGKSALTDHESNFMGTSFVFQEEEIGNRQTDFLDYSMMNFQGSLEIMICSKVLLEKCNLTLKWAHLSIPNRLATCNHTQICNFKGIVLNVHSSGPVCQLLCYLPEFWSSDTGQTESDAYEPTGVLKKEYEQSVSEYKKLSL